MFTFLPFENPAGLPPAVLAYVGDAVFELYVRALLTKETSGSMDDLHALVVSHVNAAAQAALLKEIEPQLSEEEANIVRRGRNSKCGHIPKSVSMAEYRYSTALESLIGFLYLDGRVERLNEILDECKKSWILQGGDPGESGTD